MSGRTEWRHPRWDAAGGSRIPTRMFPTSMFSSTSFICSDASDAGSIALMERADPHEREPQHKRPTDQPCDVTLAPTDQ